MAEISEGFSVNVNIVIDDYYGSDVLGDIFVYPQTVIKEKTMDYNTSIVLDEANILWYIGDIKRANSGAEGFTLKSDCAIDRIEENAVIADIRHGKVRIGEAAEDILSSVTLDNSDENYIIADIIRSNDGNQGFTLKAGIALDSFDINDFIADIKHGRIKISEDSRDTTAFLRLDSSDNTYIGDFLRSNKGHGFLLRGYLNLNDYEREKIVGDFFRSNKTKSTYNTVVFIWNGEKYFIASENDLFESLN